MTLTHSPIDQKTPTAYESPAIESVLTAESLEREVHYAGLQAVSTPPANDAGPGSGIVACF